MINSGDLVRLKSGGPVMTVSWIQRTEAYCTWFDSSDELKNAPFKIAQLKVVDGND